MRMKETIHVPPGGASAGRPLTVEAFGVSYCDGSYRIVRRNSPIHVFEYVLSGSGTLSVNGRHWTPRAGDAYMVPAGSTHAYAADARDPWIKLWFNVRGPLVARLVEAYGLEGVHHVPDCRLEAEFRAGQRQARRDLAHAHDHVAVALHRILCQLAEIRRSRAAEASPKTTMDLHRHIEAKVFGHLDLTAMSRHLGKSPSQTIRLFRREWGRTPYQHLLARKLEVAEALLASTAKSIKEIAADLGFRDAFHFSALFRRKLGISPAAWRQRHRQGLPT